MNSISVLFQEKYMIWQAFSESDAINLALTLLIKIHKSSSNMRDYLQCGKVKHWCEDPCERDGFSWPTPTQEYELSELQSSISNIHFIGEHTSPIHGWIGGSLSSAIRAALSITEKAETTFDVIIVDGGPIGLITAICLSLKQATLRIDIVEKGTIMNADSSSGAFDQRQFRQIYNEEYLAELANMSFPL
ncbi:unnamed protein product [Didymodactylos carnosus]|uniref:Amine oxidase domain-containing protein n=1 Tax=Didymodactylos carnosus TaxID=1234261 RepID=A0A815SD77_9BILA|nr:unnamed protein product [Didymodactylos carnosus]CAF4351161.1 unnamed protein product [Didymodactylos carnosus]